jgi:hypothetical protein
MTHDAGRALRFYQLAAVWKNDTIHLSNIDEKLAHPAYQAIIAMGPDVLPLIFAELQREPDDWFAALRALSGANPVTVDSPRTLNETIAAWLKWAKEHGYSNGSLVEEGLPQSQLEHVH